ncbi:potassium channel subfamily K member 18-like [Ptychodera flava]|uniref:potassium channel subfamily K member 18-like n=1 Tax=Ptychodera flava TaxID=63121 RepID=UPI00396A1E66
MSAGTAEKHVAKVREVACRFNVFRRSIRNTTILFIAAVAYVMLGGMMFKHLEGEQQEPAEAELPNITKILDVVIEDLWNSSTQLSEEDWMVRSRDKLENLTTQTFEWVKKEVLHEKRHRWSYASACFFCLTVISTIGYGSLAPITTPGRVACIFYALVGIPLFVVFLAKVGKLIAIPLKYSYKNIQTRYRCCRRFLTGNRSDGASPVSRHSSHGNMLQDKGLKAMRVYKSVRVQTDDSTGVSDDDSDIEYDDIRTENHQHASNNEALVDWRREVVRSWASVAMSDDFNAVVATLTDDQLQQSNNAEYENAPVTFIIVVLLLYIAAGSGIMKYYETTWSYLDAIYFSVITFTTVGFGDITPSGEPGKLTQHEILIRETFVSCYIVLGLVVMSIALNLGRDQVKTKVRKFVNEDKAKARKQCNKCLRGCVTSQETQV